MLLGAWQPGVAYPVSKIVGYFAVMDAARQHLPDTDGNVANGRTGSNTAMARRRALEQLKEQQQRRLAESNEKENLDVGLELGLDEEETHLPPR